MLTCIFALLTLEACTEAAILGPRQKSEHSAFPYKVLVPDSRLTVCNPASEASTTSLGRSSYILSPFVDPTLPIATSIPSATAASYTASQTSSVPSSSSTTPSTLGGVSESPDNATASSDADHGNCHRTSEEYHTTSSGPFCEPHYLQDVWAGRTYSAIWEYAFPSPSSLSSHL